MLYPQTVAEPTLDLLRRLLAIPELENFALVGGTNLSLRFGHRVSIDLDLFTPDPFDLADVQQAINKAFQERIELNARKQTLLLVIEGVKVDILLHEYTYLQSIDLIDGFRLVSLPDVIAMKLGAVAGRGARKDFWDVYELLKQYSIADMIGFYARKYPASDAGQVIRSLVYFEDAEGQENPLNPIYGYRTSLSMENQDTWIVANQLASACFLYASVGFTVVLILLSIIVGKAGLIGWFGSLRSLFLVITVLSTGIVLLPIVVTEYKLSQIFTADGARK